MSNPDIPLKKLLCLNSLICSVIAFLACRGLVESWCVFVFLALIVLSVLIDALQWRRPPRLLINAASLAIVVVAVAAVRIDSIVETFTGTVLLMVAVKMIDEKQARDHLQVATLSVIAVVCAAVLSPRAGFVLYYIIGSYFFGLGLLLCTFFAKAPLLTLSVASARQLLLRAGGIWLMMLPVCLTLFFAAPRARVALAGGPDQRGKSSAPGFVDRVTHGLIARIQRSDEVAFRAEMEQIAQNHLYWRGLVLSAFDGNEWLSRETLVGRDPGFTVQGDLVRQDIFLEQGQYHVLFTLDKPVSVRADRFMTLGEGTYIRARNRFTSQFRYDVTSAVSPLMKPNRADFNKAPYLALPQGFIPELRGIVDEITMGKGELGKIRAILDYLAPPSFTYALDDLPLSQNALKEFLFTYRRGTCEYFASSMAVMCRMAGIPARLIVGYKGGYYNDGGGYYIVRQQNAHAWVEVWDLAEEAWRRYDPTPANMSDGSERMGNAPGRFALFLDLLQHRISQFVVDYSGETRLKALERLRAFLLNPGVSFKPAMGRFKSSLLAAILLPAALLVVTGSVLLIFLLRRGSVPSPEGRVLRHFLAVMKKRGYPKHPSEGLEEYLRRLPETKLREFAWRFVMLFENDYFRDRSMKKETLSELRNIVRQIKREK